MMWATSFALEYADFLARRHSYSKAPEGPVPAAAVALARAALGV
jgi:hypothetical protein